MSRDVNSYGDECCPFIDRNTGALYFSSNGRNGFGGYDIYRSDGSGRRWSEAFALPKPLNSSYDDTYYSTLNGKEGFFTSNRPGSLTMYNGSCCDDIFYFKYNQCVTLPAAGTVFNVTNRDIYDLLNSKYELSLEYIEDSSALTNIPVKLFLLDTETGDEIFIRQTVTDEEGRYDFNLERNKEYVIIIENYGYFDKRITIKGGEYNCDETIDLKETGINFLPEITVRFNIYYEHDKSRITQDAGITIDTMLLPLFDLYPTALVEIASHTDHTGSDNYNIKVSQRRSESVVSYLISNGIDVERLVAKGYGETQPIAPNTHPDGSDNPEGRQLNRRTEFRIIGSLNSFYFDDE
jgi:outer membrane protein OmpA-like peptidoglycan-associated protein